MPQISLSLEQQPSIRHMKKSMFKSCTPNLIANITLIKVELQPAVENTMAHLTDGRYHQTMGPTGWKNKIKAMLSAQLNFF